MTDHLLHTLNHLNSPDLLVLGDIVLDRYTSGEAERVSPEAPVMVLRARSQEARLGGAASVAALLAGLEVDACLAGVVGCDADGQVLREILKVKEIGQTGVLNDSRRPTTVKHRFMGGSEGRQPQQLLRVDSETRDPVHGIIEQRLAGYLSGLSPSFDALLISDYGKGVCTRMVLEAALAGAKKLDVPILVDPARGSDWSQYKGATLLKCNRIEAEAYLGTRLQTRADLDRAAAEIQERTDVRHVVITLDGEGLVCDGKSFAARKRVPVDVTGAGDMALAMLGLCIAAGVSIDDACELTNVASGLEVERLGCTPVSRKEIRDDLLTTAKESRRKILSLPRLAERVKEHRAAGRRVVFTCGCFDLMHVGHVQCLEQAAALGDVVIVAVNSDRSVRELKGTDRPIVNQNDRASLLAALSCVDHVVVFEEPTPHVLLHRLRPDVLVKGGTYNLDEVVGREVVEGYGGEVRVVGRVDGMSTTQLLTTVRKSSGLANPPPCRRQENESCLKPSESMCVAPAPVPVS
jgi:D-beta-D-heptose 7-phosphate kinase / D-beta-D-heptose 1-phosphate adenosyltransferase